MKCLSNSQIFSNNYWACTNMKRMKMVIYGESYTDKRFKLNKMFLKLIRKIRFSKLDPVHKFWTQLS